MGKEHSVAVKNINDRMNKHYARHYCGELEKGNYRNKPKRELQTHLQKSTYLSVFEESSPYERFILLEMLLTRKTYLSEMLNAVVVDEFERSGGAIELQVSFSKSTVDENLDERIGKRMNEVLNRELECFSGMMSSEDASFIAFHLERDVESRNINGRFYTVMQYATYKKLCTLSNALNEMASIKAEEESGVQE